MLRLNKEIIKNKWFFPILLAAIYFVLNLILVLNHELWRDETNPWQVAKSMRLGNMYEVMQGEGHPLLWYFILAPFAKLGFPLVSTNIISLMILTLSVFLMARYSPFSKLTIVVFAISSGFFYFFPVISRNYCLSVLGIVLAAIAYKDRLQHPVRYALALALLCQSHFLVIGAAAVLAIVFVIEYIREFGKKRVGVLVAALGVIGLSLLLSLPIVISAFGSHDLIASGTEVPSNIDWLFQMNISLFGAVVPIFEVSFAIVLLYLYFTYPKQLIFLVIAMTWWFVILAFVYKIAIFPPQKSALVILFLMLAFWTSRYEKVRRPSEIVRLIRGSELYKATKKMPIAVVIMLIPVVATVPQTTVASLNDLNGNYSYGAEFASYVNSELPEDTIIIVSDAIAASISVTFVPQLQGDRRVYDVGEGDFVDYHRYTGYPALTEEDFRRKVGELSESYDNLYYLITAVPCDVKFVSDASWELVKTFDEHTEALESPIELYRVK